MTSVNPSIRESRRATAIPHKFPAGWVLSEIEMFQQTDQVEPGIWSHVESVEMESRSCGQVVLNVGIVEARVKKGHPLPN